jgi:hypothetical protein
MKTKTRDPKTASSQPKTVRPLEGAELRLARGGVARDNIGWERDNLDQPG